MPAPMMHTSAVVLVVKEGSEGPLSSAIQIEVVWHALYVIAFPWPTNTFYCVQDLPVEQ